MLHPYTILEKKSILLGIVLAAVIGILAVPIIMPHILHVYHMMHIGIHIGGVTLATFLAVLSVMAHHKLKTKRLLFTSAAFLVFIAAEMALVIDATWPSLFGIGPVSLLEVGHILTFITLGLLAMGVFRDD